MQERSWTGAGRACGGLVRVPPYDQMSTATVFALVSALT
jgi:hypothetical protein